MLNKFRNSLYKLDLFGPSPKLYIFKKDRYKSIFSLFFSLLIILVVTAFVLYSLINYITNDRPTVVYSKSNDKNEERKIYLNDTLIMFQLMNFDSFKKLNESIAYLQAEYTVTYNTGNTEISPLTIKKCKLGENINPKYEYFFKQRFSSLSFEYNQYDKNIEDFYCINNENSNNKLFYQPNIGYSNVGINILIKNQNLYTPENISLMIIYENNLINHDNKTFPISEGISYHFIRGFSSNEYTYANYNFQYLKYETDDGLFLDSLKYLYGKSFLDMNVYKSNQGEYDLKNNFIKYNYSIIGTIMLELNKSNYDYYRRTYKKLQALIAEIMSIVSLLFEIGRQILSFLNEKRMSVDIMRSLFKAENPIKIKRLSTKILVNESDRNKIIPYKMNNSFKLNERNIISNSIFENINNDTFNKNEIVLKRINVLNVIKSFLCNGNKDRLITLCHDIIVQDMCVETILEKFYNLGRIYDSIIDKEKSNVGLNLEQKIKELNNIINLVYNQMKKDDIKENNK